jgi:hypothetical protein
MQTTLDFGYPVQLLLFPADVLKKLHKEYLLKREQEIQDDIAEFQALIRADNFKEIGCVSKNFSRFIAW